MKCIYKLIIIKLICVYVFLSLIVIINKNKRNVFGI